MQPIEILAKLSAQELAELEKQVAAVNRTTLTRLFKELKKLRTGKREFDREKVFKAVFDEKHSADVDYKLRNETRILKKVLFQFLAQNEVLRELKQNEDFNNLWLTKALARHDLREPFEQQIESFLKTADQALDIDTALQLMLVKRSYYSAMGLANPLDNEAFMEFLEDIQEYKIRSMVRLLRDIDGSRALMVKGKATRQGHILYKDQPLQLKIRDKIILKDHEDELTYAARLKSEMYLQTGEQRIETTRKFLQVIKSLTEKGLVSVQVEVQLLETLATYLIAEEHYAEAWKALDEHVALAEANKLSASVAIYHSRLYCLVLWGKYQQALEYYEEHQTAIVGNRYFYFAVHDICYAHLFLNDTREASKLLMSYFNETTENQMFDVEYKVRFGFIITHLTDNDLESAARELMNFKRSKTYTEDESGFYKNMASLFESYLKVKHDTGSKKYHDLTQKVHDLSNRLKSPVLQLVWLQRQL